MPTSNPSHPRRRAAWTEIGVACQPKFLNADLEIDSAAKLDTLKAELGKAVFVLHSGPSPKRGRQFLALEISGFHCRGPDVIIHAFCALIEKLSPGSRRLWVWARKRFDVGYELGGPGGMPQFAFRPDTLERAAKLGADLAVTCYRPEHPGVSRPANPARRKPAGRA